MSGPGNTNGFSPAMDGYKITMVGQGISLDQHLGAVGTAVAAEQEKGADQLRGAKNKYAQSLDQMKGSRALELQKAYTDGRKRGTVDQLRAMHQEGEKLRPSLSVRCRLGLVRYGGLSVIPALLGTAGGAIGALAALGLLSPHLPLAIGIGVGAGLIALIGVALIYSPWVRNWTTRKNAEAARSRDLLMTHPVEQQSSNRPIARGAALRQTLQRA